MVCRTSSEVTFQDLRPGSYFPMVSRHGVVSFFGAPPDPVVIRERCRPLPPLPRVKSPVSPSYGPASPSLTTHGLHGDDVETSYAPASPSYGPATPSCPGFGADDDGEGPCKPTPTGSSSRSETKTHIRPTATELKNIDTRAGHDTTAQSPPLSPSHEAEWKKDWSSWREWHTKDLPNIASSIFYNATTWASCSKVRLFLCHFSSLATP